MVLASSLCCVFLSNIVQSALKPLYENVKDCAWILHTDALQRLCQVVNCLISTSSCPQLRRNSIAPRMELHLCRLQVVFDLPEFWQSSQNQVHCSYNSINKSSLVEFDCSIFFLSHQNAKEPRNIIFNTQKKPVWLDFVLQTCNNLINHLLLSCKEETIVHIADTNDFIWNKKTWILKKARMDMRLKSLRGLKCHLFSMSNRSSANCLGWHVQKWNHKNTMWDYATRCRTTSQCHLHFTRQLHFCPFLCHINQRQAKASKEEPPNAPQKK